MNVSISKSGGGSWRYSLRTCALTWSCLLAAVLPARGTVVTLDASQDAWVDQPVANQNDNHGSDAILDVQGGSSSQIKRRALVQFDLGSIPACSEVSGATLQIRVKTAGASSRSHGVHRLLKAWTEEGVTWLKTDGSVPWDGGGANASSDSNSSPTATASTGTTDGVILSWDVTADVGEMVEEPSTNHGWLLRDESEGFAVLVTYDSRDSDSVDAVPPRLVVTYSLSDAKCDDDNACTTDTCSATGCQYANNNSSCDDAVYCNGTDVCDGGVCTHSGDPCSGPDGDEDCAESCNESAADCSGADPDGTLCRPSTGACDVEETCLNGACPADSFAGEGTSCGDPTNTDCDGPDTCDGNNNCQTNYSSAGTACGDPSDTDCSNPDTCNGAGECLSNDELAGTACPDDGEACTADQCDGGGTCTHPAGNAGAECRAAAGDCDVAETCDGSSTACPADVLQLDDTPCDDGLFCNGVDSCANGLCANHAEGVCTFVCDEPNDQCITDECPDFPQDTCRRAGKSQLLVKKSSNIARDKLIWKFIRGASTSFEELGDPTDDTDYTLCIYTGQNETLTATVDVAPNGSTWRVLGNDKGYKYKDKSGPGSGVQKMKLKASAKDKTRILLKGAGASLPEILGPLGLEMPVKTQLLNQRSGVCWEGVFSATPKKNTSSQFKAKQ